MKVIYYVLPTTIGSQVVVSETPSYDDVEVALLLSEADAAKDFFDIEYNLETEEVTNVEKSTSREPLFYYDENYLIATLPLNSSVEASFMMNFIHEKTRALDTFNA